MSNTYISTIAGNLLAGAGIVINLETLWQYSLPSFEKGIFSDKDRQLWLALLCLVGQINVVPISIYQIDLSPKQLTISATVGFMCMLYGLTLLVHNSLVRIYVALCKKINLNLFNRICCILYILPIVAYTPYWILIIRYWNSSASPTADLLFTQVWEPILFFAVVFTEALALISDVLLFRNILSSHQSINRRYVAYNPTMNKFQATEDSSSMKAIWRKIPFLKNVSSCIFSLMIVYILIWVTLTLDIILKSLVVATNPPFVFDGAVTLLGLSLRSAANLSFGTTVKTAMRGKTNVGTVTNNRGLTPTITDNQSPKVTSETAESWNMTMTSQSAVQM